MSERKLDHHSDIEGGDYIRFVEDPGHSAFVVSTDKRYRVWMEHGRPYFNDETGYPKPLELLDGFDVVELVTE